MSGWDAASCKSCGPIFDAWLKACGVASKDGAAPELHALWMGAPERVRFYMLAGALESRRLVGGAPS